MSSRSVEKQRKNKRLSDAEFVRKYFECGENQAELARKLRVTRQSVGDRLKRIGKEEIEQARQAGKVSIIASKQQAIKAVAFKAGQAEGIRQWGYLEAAEEVLSDQRRIADRIKAEIEEWLAVPGRKLKPFQVQMLLLTQGGILKSCEVLHRIRRDINNVADMECFYEAVLQVVLEEQPSARQRIYQKLLNIRSTRAEYFK